MFSRVDFRKDEKKKKKKKREIENEEGKHFGECLVGRERGENDDGTRVFSLGPAKKFSP